MKRFSGGKERAISCLKTLLSQSVISSLLSALRLVDHAWLSVMWVVGHAWARACIRSRNRIDWGCKYVNTSPSTSAPC